MGIVESGRCDTAFNSVSMSRVKDVEVGAGIDVVEVHGVVGPLLCHPSHSCKLNLKFTCFLTVEGDFFRQEFS